jgi:hypothetical protein
VPLQRGGGDRKACLVYSTCIPPTPPPTIYTCMHRVPTSFLHTEQGLARPSNRALVPVTVLLAARPREGAHMAHDPCTHWPLTSLRTTHKQHNGVYVEGEVFGDT